MSESVSEQDVKTFQQIFFDKQFDFELETYESEDVPFWIINDSVIAWLEQKQQHMTKANGYNRDHLNGKNEMLKELIEELKNECS